MQTILKMLRQNRYPNFTSFIREMRAQDAAGAYELSSKTFSRDIAALRDIFGAPIHYDACRKGFYLSDPEWYDEEMMVEPCEMKAALLGERAASGLFPEPLRGEIEKAVSALLMKNETGMAEGADIASFQVLPPEGLPKIDPRIFLTAYNAWERRRRLKLVYRSSQDHVSEKLFEPHVFAWNGGCWYLKGKVLRDGGVSCAAEPKIRVLALHRIESAEMLSSEFDIDPAIAAAVKRSGLFDFDAYPEVDIEFFAPFAKPMAERYPEQVIARTPDSVRLKLKVASEYEAVQLVFRACGNAKVHAPECLRTYLRRIIGKLEDHLDS